MKRTRFICMVGLSASGKSTQAAILAKHYNANIHSSDSLREELFGNAKDRTHNEEVFKELHRRVKQDLLEGKSVIYDATNINIKSRRGIMESIKKIDCIKEAYIMIKPIKKCISDNVDRIVSVPTYAIEAQSEAFQIPFREEGFDEITLHRCDGFIGYNKDKILDLIEGFDQKTKWHKYDLLTHCNNCAKELREVGAEEILIEAAKIHDYGKVFCQKLGEDGNCHYYKHENIGTYLLLHRLGESSGYTDDEILDMLFYVNYHMLPFMWMKEKTHNKYRRLFGDNKYNNLLMLHRADRKATGVE